MGSTTRRRGSAVLRAGLLALAAAVLAVGGCAARGEPSREGSTTPSQSAGGIAKHVDAGVHDDAEAIASVVPALGRPTRATWVTGTLGEQGRAPGPELRWYDAVVELEPEVADRLREESGAGPTTGTLDVASEIADRVPQGEYVGGEELDALLSSPGTRVHARLEADGTTLALTALPG